MLTKDVERSGNNTSLFLVWFGAKLVLFLFFARLRELENQLVKLEASNPSAPPALKFKVRFYGLLYFAIVFRSYIYSS